MQTVLEFLQPLLDLMSAYPYLFFFVAMIFAGEVVLLPAIYMAVTGRLDLLPVVTLSITATMISDIFWYGLGRWFPATALERIPGRGTGRIVAGLGRLFERNGPHVLILSKFVYGTRISAQVLSGVHDMPFRIYLGANALGVIAVTASLVLIAYSVIGTTTRLGEAVRGVEIAFLLFVFIVVLGYFLVGRKLRREWFR